jgi:hypothetical protein
MSVGEHIRALPFAGVNQTSFMFGAVVFAYLFFITVRGDLAKWLGLLGLAGGGVSGGGVSGGGVSGGGVNAPAVSGAPAGVGLPALPSIPNLSGI